MKVLVIGGTGFIGSRIVEKFLERGDEVSVFTRGRSRPGFWSDVETIIGDRRDHTGFRRRLEGRRFEAVIDNVASAGADVQAAVSAFMDRADHYVLTSSGAVYRDYEDWRQWRPVYEEDADLTFRGDFPYAEGRREAEQVLWSLSTKDAPLPFTILRPTVVEGPRDSSGRTWFWIQRLADGGDVLVPQARFAAIFRHVFVDDVADLVLRVAGSDAAFRKAYNAAGEEILSLEDYVGALAACLDRRGGVVAAPLDRVREYRGLSEFDPPFFLERFVMDIARARRDLGYRPTPLGAWLPRTVAWFTEEYRGPDSEGYENRQAEIAAAKMHRR